MNGGGSPLLGSIYVLALLIGVLGWIGDRYGAWKYRRRQRKATCGTAVLVQS